jgi:hypothetical protein
LDFGLMSYLNISFELDFWCIQLALKYPYVKYK